MRIPGIEATREAGLPFFLPGGPEAVLLLHGYTGLADEFRYLGSRLSEAGFTVSVPRLPGHGTNAADFLASRAEDWLRKAADEYRDLRSRFPVVHAAGLSMGALLAILIAAEDAAAGKIVLAAPAIRNTDRRILLTPFLKLFFEGLPRRDYVFDGPEKYREISRAYWEKTWVAPAAELLKLQRAARKALPRVTAPAFVIVSRNDKTVPLAAADLIEKRIGSPVVRRMTLKDSGHVVVNGSEKEEVADSIISFLSCGD